VEVNHRVRSPDFHRVMTGHEQPGDGHRGGVSRLCMSTMYPNAMVERVLVHQVRHVEENDRMLCSLPRSCTCVLTA